MTCQPQHSFNPQALEAIRILAGYSQAELSSDPSLK